MSWEFVTTTYPVARKEYRCEASDWILNCGLGEDDFSPEHWDLIEKARLEKWKIIPGTQYVKAEGKWEGDFTVYRARKDLHQICLDYDLYQE